MNALDNYKKTESAEGWHEDGIAHYIFKKSKIDMPEAVEAVELLTRICEGQPHAFYIDISKVKSITKEAREYLSRPDASKENNLGTGVLAPNVFSKLIGTFFITFNNPKIKIKLFTDKEDAIKWCKK